MTKQHAAPTFLEFCERINVPLSPAQAALAAVCFDGAPIPEEWAHMFGGLTGPVPASARRTIAWLCGRASGKSREGAAYVLWRATHSALPKLGAGELAFAALVAPSLELARQALRFARGMLNDTKYERAIVAETSDSFTLKRPDGKSVRVQVFAADRGGAALRGKSFCAAVLDEACFFRSKDSAAVVNDGDIHDAIMPRLLVGGSIVLASTPWVQSGKLHEFWSKQFGKPSTALVAVAKTEDMRTDDAQLLLDVAAKRAENPDNAAREFDCEWLAVGTGSVFDADHLKASLTDEEPTTDGTIAIGGDLGLVSDPSAFVAVRVHNDGSVSVLDVREYKGRKGEPVHAASMLADVADWAQKLGASPTVKVDGHGFAFADQIRRDAGIGLSLHQISEGADRERRFRYATDLFAAGKVHIPRSLARLTEQLSLLVQTPKDGGGYKFTAPRRDGHHCDLAMAFILAIDGAMALETFSKAMHNTTGLAAINEILFSGPRDTSVIGQIEHGRMMAALFDEGPARPPTEADREQCRQTFAEMRAFMQRKK